MKRAVISVALLTILLAAGYAYYLYFLQNQQTPAGERGRPQANNQEESCPRKTASEVTINYTSDGFKPSCVRVSPGTKITWNNQQDDILEVGTNPHPIHSGNRAISNGEFTLNIPSGTKGSTTLNEPGSYKYHDHVNASAGGEVIVE